MKMDKASKGIKDRVDEHNRKMMYVAYRLDRQRYDGSKMIDGYFLFAQRDTDLNWEYICTFPDRDTTISHMKKLHEFFGTPWYNENGYMKD